MRIMAAVLARAKRDASNVVLVDAPHGAPPPRLGTSSDDLRQSPAYRALRHLHATLQEQQRQLVRLPTPATREPSLGASEVATRQDELLALRAALPPQAMRAVAAYRAAVPAVGLSARAALSARG